MNWIGVTVVGNLFCGVWKPTVKRLSGHFNRPEPPSDVYVALLWLGKKRGTPSGISLFVIFDAVHLHFYSHGPAVVLEARGGK